MKNRTDFRKPHSGSSRGLVGGLLMLIALMTIGCSTPKVVESVETESSAWNAYESCVMSLAPYGRADECDQVGAQGGMSYQQWSRSNGADISWHTESGTSPLSGSSNDGGLYSQNWSSVEPSQFWYSDAGSAWGNGSQNLYADNLSEQELYAQYLYAHYLSSLKPSSLRAMKAQWEALANEQQMALSEE